MDSLDLLRVNHLQRLSSPDEPGPIPQEISLSRAFAESYKEAEISTFQGLGPGSKGTLVQRLQKTLARWNPRLGVENNGVFDLKTERALALYQAIYSSAPTSGGISKEVSGHLVRMENGSFWTNPPTKSPGQMLLYQAAQHLDKPYRLGGDGLYSTDCGRLVQQAATQLSPALGRCADEQYRSACQGQKGLSVCARPRAGDLAFFRFPTSQSAQAYAGVTHVGIHVDSNWTLAASAGAGKVVLQKSAPLRPFLVANAGFR